MGSSSSRCSVRLQASIWRKIQLALAVLAVMASAPSEWAASAWVMELAAAWAPALALVLVSVLVLLVWVGLVHSD
jgi:hypothetical protein